LVIFLIYFLAKVFYLEIKLTKNGGALLRYLTSSIKTNFPQVDWLYFDSMHSYNLEMEKRYLLYQLEKKSA